MHRLSGFPVALAIAAALLVAGVAPANAQPSAEELERNKQTALAFYDMAGNWNMPREAAAMYMGPMYIQHNPLAGDGAEAFIAFFTGFKTQFPNARWDFKRVAAEGDLVWVHSHFTLGTGDRGSAVVDIFRIENGKIVEHWDVLQQVPERSLNDNTMF
jgi:predicted SnoaL-like aldol condensation-catalyzing enzyme